MLAGYGTLFPQIKNAIRYESSLTDVKKLLS